MTDAPTPFAQGRFDALPKTPRLPHAFFRVEALDVVVDHAPFGAKPALDFLTA